MNEIIPGGVPDVDPNQPVVSFVMLECRTCGQRSGWVRKDDNAYQAWDEDHAKSARHRRFYLWSITRHTAQVFLG